MTFSILISVFKLISTAQNFKNNYYMEIVGLLLVPISTYHCKWFKESDQMQLGYINTR